MKEESKMNLWQRMSVKQKLFGCGLMLLLSLGAFGAMGGFSENNDNGLISSIGKAVGLKKETSTKPETLQPLNGTPKLSKEYVYAGSRMLATEDYGIAPTNPTPTPLPSGGSGGNPTPTPTPNGTPTPTPTPTPPPDPNTGCPWSYSSLGGIIVTNPTAEVINGRVVVFATGTDHRLYYQYSTGGAFSGWNVIQYGGTYEDTMSEIINSTMYVEIQGGDGNRYYISSTDGMNFTNFVQGSVNVYQRHPSATLNGQTYNFVKGTGSQPHLCVQIGNQAPSGNTATFVASDSNTQGNWIGVYGGQGYSLVGDATNLPSYLQFSATGNNSYTWAASTSDPRGLIKASNNNDRIAATWWSQTQFDLNFNFTDGQNHYLTLHTINWDNYNRSEQFEVYDGTTNALLDTRTVTDFVNGKYLKWQVKGNIKIRVKNNLGTDSNAVVGGFFVD